MVVVIESELWWLTKSISNAPIYFLRVVHFTKIQQLQIPHSAILLDISCSLNAVICTILCSLKTYFISFWTISCDVPVSSSAVVHPFQLCMHSALSILHKALDKHSQITLRFETKLYLFTSWIIILRCTMWTREASYIIKINVVLHAGYLKEYYVIFSSSHLNRLLSYTYCTCNKPIPKLSHVETLQNLCKMIQKKPIRK